MLSGQARAFGLCDDRIGRTRIYVPASKIVERDGRKLPMQPRVPTR